MLQETDNNEGTDPTLQAASQIMTAVGDVISATDNGDGIGGLVGSIFNAIG